VLSSYVRFGARRTVPPSAAAHHSLTPGADGLWSLDRKDIAMNTIRTHGLVAASSVAVLLALTGCGERTDDQTVGQKVDSAISRTAEAGRDVKEGAKEAGQDTAAAARRAGEETKEATARAGEATREATADARTSVMGAAQETREAGARVGEKVDDSLITGMVKTGLAADKDLKALNIDVDTKEGVVTLQGTAPTATAKARAAEIARNVKDVKSVNNQLNVAG
jgi:hyperosmotically inducible protein